MLLVLLFALGCRDSSGPVATSTAKPKTRAPLLCPLTGEKAPEGLPKDRPALAIKVDNASRARPQAGLGSADIVYEELAEGGVTRLLAVFHCKEAVKVGPVRSARTVDPDILREYAPVLLGYSGANREVLRKVRSTDGVVDLQYATNAEGYQKVRGRPAPHDIFTSTASLRALSDITGRPKIGLIFAESRRPEPAKNGSTNKATKTNGSLAQTTSSPSPEPVGTAVSFTFAGSAATRYLYDIQSNRYQRSVGDKPFLLDDGSQVSATNVVVLKVRVWKGQTKDAAGNFSPEIIVTGSGEAVVLFQGRVTNVRWTRKGLSDRMRLVDESGADAPLHPGNTWIHLLPADRPVTVE